MLGRLLRQDANRKNEARITSLFEEAYQLASDNAEVTFRHGQWLLSGDKQTEQGIELLQKATQLQPENALYWGTSGQYMLEAVLKVSPGDFGGDSHSNLWVNSALNLSILLPYSILID
jgi:hypothetical protein